MKSLFSGNKNNKSLRIVQIFEYYSLIETNYGFYTQIVIEAFGESFIDYLHLKFLPRPTSHPDERKDKLAEHLDQNFLYESRTNLLMMVIMAFVVIICIIIKKIILKKKIDNSLDRTKKLDKNKIRLRDKGSTDRNDDRVEKNYKGKKIFIM